MFRKLAALGAVIFVCLIPSAAQGATGYVTEDDFANRIGWASQGTDLGWTMTNVKNNTGATGDFINSWVNQYGVYMSNWNYNTSTYVGGATIQYYRFNNVNSAWHCWQGWYTTSNGIKHHYGNTGTPLQ